MILRKTFIMEKWSSWDHEINIAVLSFHSQFQIYPNILLANNVTYSRINLIIDKNRVTRPSGERPGKYEYVNLGSFSANDYELEFCVDDGLPEKHISLIYDSDPSDDGEPVPEDDTDNAKEKIFLKTA